MQEIECENCGWQGKWSDIQKFEKSKVEICPDCGYQSLIELDGVSSDDYLKQESIERPRE